MAISRYRFIPLKDIGSVFAACVVPIHSWATLTFLYQVTGWIVYLNVWDVIGTFAYTQAFAFLESLVVLLCVILLAVILPARVLRDRFVPLGGMLVLLNLAWAIAVQYTGIIPFTRYVPWHSKKFLLGAVAYLVSLGASYVWVRRHERVQGAVSSFVERLTVLLYIYIPLSLASIVILIIRNF